ncbi:Putative protein [Zobellia galactanivorans]|uniref:Uncharacterized protein n=1 Tax=Zobellia galactanivorans (strain DSM 12802 / CCUG 47099 / CIP 106680 / NCIMB 13871 / Dsij) TaxID=63186 RepID=G0LCI3_ZOBGA|nr:Putative protein [Zobellia galactanivorans]
MSRNPLFFEIGGDVLFCGKGTKKPVLPPVLN